MPYCAYGSCNSDSKVGRPGYDPTIKFYRFPQPCLLLRDNVLNWSDLEEKKHVKTCEKCTISNTWIIRCKRADARLQKVRNISKDTTVCSKHFGETPDKIDYQRHFPSARPANVPSQVRRRQRLELRRHAPSANTHPDRLTGECSSSSNQVLLPPSGESLNEMAPPGEAPLEEDDLIMIPPEQYTEEAPEEIVCLEDAISPSCGILGSAVQEYLDTRTTSTSSTQTPLRSSEDSDWEKKYHALEKYCKSLESELTLMKAKEKVSAITAFEKQLRSNENECKFFTGMTCSQLTVLVSIFEGKNITYWGENNQNNLSNESARVACRDRKLTRFQELIVFFLRVRGGFLVQTIAYWFSLSNALISRTVTTWILALYGYFNGIRKEMFFSRDVIKKHLPPRFKNTIFKNIRVIIDCAEIRCEKPSNFEQQGNSYSEYKAHTTFKVLVGCAPNGAVTFMSELFEGSITDRCIVEKSGLVELLEEGDLVLADRGFTISDLTDGKGVVLKIPAFLKGRDKLTPQEEMETREIAANRIFVEHVVGRLKNFRFLQRVVPRSMRHILSQIVFVCGCLLNFQEPLVK